MIIKDYYYCSLLLFLCTALASSYGVFYPKLLIRRYDGLKEKLGFIPSDKKCNTIGNDPKKVHFISKIYPVWMAKLILMNKSTMVRYSCTLILAFSVLQVITCVLRLKLI